MGLSRNKVAVSEGAAGSPPFYGEMTELNRVLCNSKVDTITKDDEIRVHVVCCSILKDYHSSMFLYKKEQKHTNGGVAQLGEHLPCKQGVMGSNPIISIPYGENKASDFNTGS